jgi:hypothetical protein
MIRKFGHRPAGQGKAWCVSDRPDNPKKAMTVESLQQIVSQYLVNNPRLLKKICLSYLQYCHQPIDTYVMVPIVRWK